MCGQGTHTGSEVCKWGLVHGWEAVLETWPSLRKLVSALMFFGNSGKILRFIPASCFRDCLSLFIYACNSQ